VQFKIAMNGANGYVQQVESPTSEGVASVSFSIDRPGLLEIRASSGQAISSEVLQLNVTSEGSSVTIVTPRLFPSIPHPYFDRSYSNARTVDASSAGISWLRRVAVSSVFPGRVRYGSIWLGNRFTSMHWGNALGDLYLSGGLLTYTYFAIRLPGATAYLQLAGWSGMMGVVLVGAALGLSGAYAWFRLAGNSMDLWDQRSDKADQQQSSRCPDQNLFWRALDDIPE